MILLKLCIFILWALLTIRKQKLNLVDFPLNLLLPSNLAGKKVSHPAIFAPLKLAVHFNTSEVSYCSVYTNCTRIGFLQVSRTNLAAPLNDKRGVNRLCQMYVQLYLHALSL